MEVMSSGEERSKSRKKEDTRVLCDCRQERRGEHSTIRQVHNILFPTYFSPLIPRWWELLEFLQVSI